MQDYPAAHSMDTDWFAVDAEGNIAILKSGGEGAVPSANSLPDMENFIVKFPKNNRGVVHLPIDGKIVLEKADLKSPWEVFSYSGMVYEVLIVLSSEDAIAELNSHPIIQFSGTDTVVYTEACSTETIKNLIASGKIIAGTSDFNLLENAHLFGLFIYDNDWWGIPAPYKRLKIPTHPLKLNDLPSELQQNIKKVHFDSISFASAKEIQPIEHLPCDIWRSDSPDYWLDTKRERPEWEEFDWLRNKNLE